MKKVLIFLFVLCSLSAFAQPTLQDTTRFLVFDPVKSFVTTGAGIRAHSIGNSFTSFTGPTTTVKTFTLPNASATILTTNAPVTVAQGGTNATSAGITAFNNITGYSAAGATGTTSSNLVFSTNPTFINPSLGTPAAGNLSNCIGLPLSTGVSGTLPIARGGTGTGSTLAGILQGGDVFQGITSSTVGQVLRVTGTDAFAFGAVDLADGDAVTGVLPAANGGNETTTGRATGQTAANNNVVTVTVGGADASYTISGNILITHSESESISLVVDYTDEGSTGQSQTIPILRLNGALLTSTLAISGDVPYSSFNLHIRCKAGTSITIKTTGGFTGCTYNVEGRITKI